MNITNNNSPNTTLLLPGSCNASCDFCFWNREATKVKMPDDYLDKVFKNLENLPPEFRTLSISGGEPTLSPYFSKVLSRLSNFRRRHTFEKVVLTTHAGNLLPNLMLVGAVVDHINISRHSTSTEENYRIFGTDKVPSDEQLETIISEVHSFTDCDVTLNCVINPDVPTDFIYSFIDYAKSIGADAVSFRKVASDTTPTFAEYIFGTTYGVTEATTCPVCRGMSQVVNGFDVRWKGSVLEPSIKSNGVYELVIHPDANVYSDWGMTQPIELTKPTPMQVAVASIKYAECARPVYGSSGCGASSCGSSGC